MQKLTSDIAPTPRERSDVYMLCLEAIDQAETWLPGWFTLANDLVKHPKFEDIYRDNLAEWLSWAFFNLPLESVLQDESTTQELHKMINDFENKFHIKLKEGYNEDVVAYRLTLDPLLAYPRPLAFYVLVLFLTNIFGFVCQFLWGMKRFGPENRSTVWSLMDPQQSPYPSSHIGPEKVPYWFRDGNRRKKPIVFIHGIGGGLMCYITFVAKLVTLDAPIFFIELPFVAMNCVEEVPTAQETVRDIQQMLQRHGCTDAVFVGHSLAVLTLYTEHLRQPLSCSVTMPENTKVYLSEKDNIVNSLRVNDYLNRHGIDSTVMQGLDHASFLFHSIWKNEILMTINKYTSI
ncbi:hypothetical protein BCV71DRAFT_246819 [Rhizopus microsporus]|uniref:AB hydrolase-1 domain-containing protein n=1 Tax=Rhizopus microsporus TaxID=58291 RepID=A0A1X0RKQ4_RHIZD|nr:hypothetical protein BCV71DRAFT_246819 [Rhizopus microsporus]